MKVKQINLDDDAMPSTVVVEMSRREAVWIATITGKHSDASANDVLSGYGEVNGEVYDCLAGDFFNRFWDEGVEGAR